MITCGCDCTLDPEGIWSFEEMVGAKVTIKSMPVGNVFGKMAGTKRVYTIKDIYFRVTIDGKTITLIELEGKEMEGVYFNWKDLIIRDINRLCNIKPICDMVVCSCNTIVCK